MVPTRPFATLWAALLLGAGPMVAGCATTEAITDPPLDVAVEVSNVDQRQRNLIEKHVCTFEGVSECGFQVGATLVPVVIVPAPGSALELNATNEKEDAPQTAKPAPRAPAKAADGEATDKDAAEPGPLMAGAIDPDLQKVTAVLRFRYRGRVDQLRYHIGQLPHPGLTPQVARTSLFYDGFDNTSPTVTILNPVGGRVLTTREVEVEVDIPDFDIKSVTVNTTQATFAPTGHYHATLTLEDGPHTISVAALDESGNETAKSVSMTVDTTPPALTVKVTKVSDTKMNLRGSPGDAESLTLDGKPLKFGDFYQKLVDIDPDKKTAELVATDAHGNKTTLIVPLEDGTTLPAP